jgi:hypothetical protein
MVRERNLLNNENFLFLLEFLPIKIGLAIRVGVSTRLANLAKNVSLTCRKYVINGLTNHKWVIT